MSNNQKYIALHGGKECKPINPFDGNFSSEQYDDFEATKPTYALTEVMPEGETFSGEQIERNNIFDYKIDDVVNVFCFGDLIQVKVIGHSESANKVQLGYIPGCGTGSFYASLEEIHRNNSPIAIKPIKAIEPELEGFIKVPNEVYEFLNEVKLECVDVVENKETVEQYTPIQHALLKTVGILQNIRHETDYMSDMYYEWIDDVLNQVDEFTIPQDDPQQSNSIEGIVGFVLEYIQEWVAPIYESSKQKDEFKSDIIKEYNNGK